MNKNEEVMSFFDTLLPEAKCELNYTKDYELLIAVMLSAQTTDKRVNLVTKKLFSHYPSLKDLSNARIEDVASDIKELGMVKAKGKNVIEIAKALISRFNGVVPQSKEELMSLPGVGIKTANVVLGELFNIPAFAVDTHVHRLAIRLGYNKANDNVTKVEETLKKEFPEDRYIKLHHQFIHFGRYYCKAIKPNCELCKLQKYCILKK